MEPTHEPSYDVMRLVIQEPSKPDKLRQLISNEPLSISSKDQLPFISTKERTLISHNSPPPGARPITVRSLHPVRRVCPIHHLTDPHGPNQLLNERWAVIHNRGHITGHIGVARHQTEDVFVVL